MSLAEFQVKLYFSFLKQVFLTLLDQILDKNNLIWFILQVHIYLLVYLEKHQPFYFTIYLPFFNIECNLKIFCCFAVNIFETL